jgi:hypothetical protein
MSDIGYKSKAGKFLSHEDLKAMMRKDPLIKTIVEDRVEYIKRTLNRWPFKLGKEKT